MDQARVRLRRIDVDKEKEKLRKQIKQGTSTLTKEMCDTLRSSKLEYTFGEGIT